MIESRRWSPRVVVHVHSGKFYEELFGWRIQCQGQYAVVRNGDKLIAGTLQANPPDGSARDGVWIPSVSVADVDTVA